MRGRSEKILFHEYEINNVVDQYRAKLLTEIQGYAPNVMLNTPTSDLAERLAEKFAIRLPVIDREGAHVAQQEAEIELRRGGDYDFYSDGYGPHTVTGTEVTLTIPFSGDHMMFFVRPNTFNYNPPRADIDRGQLRITVSGRQLSPQQVKASIEDSIAGIEQYLGWLKQSVAQFNNSLKAVAETAIEQRKAKLLADQNLVAGLGFKLQARQAAPQTYVAPQMRRRIEPVRPSTTAPFKPEPVLDEQTYQSILSIIENMTHVMERSPSAFAAIDEEALRQHFLMQLNGQFEGQATGETFNFLGKTDILVRVEGRNIFIGECKFWRGEKAFIETIDQVLGYLSWRDTKAAILLFNRNKAFSEVVMKAEAAMKGHAHVKRGPAKEGETRSRWVLGNPTDHNREIVLTLLAFDVPTKP